MDFDHHLNQKIVVKPGEVYAGIPVDIVDDTLPENNETFHLTLTTSDDVTTVTTGFTTITIQDNGMYSNNKLKRANPLKINVICLQNIFNILVGRLGKLQDSMWLHQARQLAKKESMQF